jgi:hypothetical protein
VPTRAAKCSETLETDPPTAEVGLGGASDDIGSAVYFSFMTLTSVGYGDIAPAAPAARALAMLEAVFGQLYLAVLIARLVSLYERER